MLFSFIEACFNESMLFKSQNKDFFVKAYCSNILILKYTFYK